MAVLADLERLLERVFERSTARLFRAHLQPVQLERRVERSMERARAAQAGRTVVPARYRVRLEPEDLADVAGASGGAEALAGRLADAALAFARAHAYQLPGRPSVALVADPTVQRGVIEVDAVAWAPHPATGSRPTPATRPATLPTPSTAAIVTPEVAGTGPHDVRDAARPVARPDAAGHGVPDVPLVRRAGLPLDPPAPGPAAAPSSALDPALAPEAGAMGRAAAPPLPGPADPAPAPTENPVAVIDEMRSDSIRGDGTRTLVFRKPAPAPTRAVLRVVARDGTERTIEVDGTPLTLGRAADNGLVLADPRVSRHHARLQARRGTLVLTDLGSTNGSRVNGVRVDECALGTGDRVLLGDTVLLVEQLPG